MTAQNLSISQPQLVAAWNTNLPLQLHEADTFQIRGDSSDENTLRIHIDTAGHTGYSFDFKCTYIDDRAVRVDLIDVEKNNTSIDERTEIVQELVDDYVRHIHECAQAVQDITHH